MAENYLTLSREDRLEASGVPAVPSGMFLIQPIGIALKVSFKGAKTVS
jgi:hypothetical protein